MFSGYYNCILFCTYHTYHVFQGLKGGKTLSVYFPTTYSICFYSILYMINYTLSVWFTYTHLHFYTCFLSCQFASSSPLTPTCDGTQKNLTWPPCDPCKWLQDFIHYDDTMLFEWKDFKLKLNEAESEQISTSPRLVCSTSFAATSTATISTLYNPKLMYVCY